MARIFIPKEYRAGEARVAASPESVKRLIKEGFEVIIETEAGDGACFSDAQFEGAGARIVLGSGEDWSSADVVLKVTPTGPNPKLSGDEVEALKPGAILIGLLEPYRHPGLVRRFAERQITTLPMELIPRITRAQGMDVLSSQANIAGYKAVLLAAGRLGKYFPLLMTAAGTVPAARVVIIGAGVAGLQAVATARRLGAIVEVSDVRPAVKEQVESLGGRFIELPTAESGEGTGGYAKEVSKEFLEKQRATLKQHVAAADVVITTAQVPGKKAPVIVTRDMVEAMHPGSIIVDIAAERGGNCELTQAEREVVHQGVLILGPTNLPSMMATGASLLYARNVLALVLLLVKDRQLVLDREDEIVRGTLLTHGGDLLQHQFAPEAAGVVA